MAPPEGSRRKKKKTAGVQNLKYVHVLLCDYATTSITHSSVFVKSSIPQNQCSVCLSDIAVKIKVVFAS